MDIRKWKWQRKDRSHWKIQDKKLRLRTFKKGEKKHTGWILFSATGNHWPLAENIETSWPAGCWDSHPFVFSIIVFLPSSLLPFLLSLPPSPASLSLLCYLPLSLSPSPCVCLKSIKEHLQLKLQSVIPEPTFLAPNVSLLLVTYISFHEWLQRHRG